MKTKFPFILYLILLFAKCLEKKVQTATLSSCYIPLYVRNLFFFFNNLLSVKRTNMDDAFFSHDVREDNSYEHSQQGIKIYTRDLPFIESINKQLIVNYLKDGIFAIEKPLKEPSTLHQSKTSVTSSAKKSDFDQNSNAMPQNNDKVVFYSDSQENQIPMQNSHYFELKEYKQDYQQREKSIDEEKDLEPESFSQQNFKLKQVQKKQKKQKYKNPAPKIATRNILQYFWKVFKNYFTGKKKQINSPNKEQLEKMRQIWDQMNQLKPSLSSFTELFRNNKMKPYFKEIFKSRFLMREIVSSSMKQNTKATYLRYVKHLLTGFLSKDLQYLN